MITRFTPLLLLLCSSATAAKEPLRPRSLLEEMHTLSVVDKELKDRLPTYYNQYLVTGYFEMPSARMAPEGVVAASIGKIGNAFIYGINVQVLDQLELAGNYRTFGDKVGLNGDVSPDRTGHIKIQIPVPTNGLHSIPYVALGIEQSLGTGHYTSLYGALTQEFLSKNLELSIGWGAGGINGLFGAAAWTPFRKKDNNFFNALSLIVEYDATRKISVAIDSLNTSIVPINFGASMLIEDYLQCSLFSAGGKTLAGNISLRYPIGTTHGLFLKKNDPKLFKKPKQEKAATPDWATSIEAGCKEQKLPIIKMAASRAGDGEFWMVIANPFYRDINEALERVLLVLEGLIPEHLLLLHITVQSDGCPIQTYTLTRAQLLSLTSRGMRRAEIKERLIVSSPKPFPTPYETQLLYENKKPIINWGITPRALVLFGGNEGFLKYHIDALLGVSGTLWNRLFFDFTYSYPIVGSLANLAAGADRSGCSSCCG